MAPAWIGAAYPVQVIGETIRDVHVEGDPQIRDWYPYVTDRRTEENVIRLYMLLVPRKPRSRCVGSSSGGATHGA